MVALRDFGDPTIRATWVIKSCDIYEGIVRYIDSAASIGLLTTIPIYELRKTTVANARLDDEQLSTDNDNL